MRSNFQQTVSFCLGLRTQKPGLREVDLKPSPRRETDKTNMLKRGRNTEKKASRRVEHRLTCGFQYLERQIWNPVLREELVRSET